MQNFRQLVDFVVSGNLHTKFHALLICLGFDARDDMLSNEEEKKLLRAQHYLDDKDATLWRAFSRELGEEVRAYACGRLFVCARARVRAYVCVCAHTHTHTHARTRTRS